MNCEDCKHYSKEYCNLMDELVSARDHCGLYNNGDE